MNRLVSRPWFAPGLATLCYLAGFNDELLHLIGSWWLGRGRAVQTIVVVAVLALAAYLAIDRIRERRSFYDAAVRAALAPEAPIDSTKGSATVAPSGEGRG